VCSSDEKDDLMIALDVRSRMACDTYICSLALLWMAKVTALVIFCSFLWSVDFVYVGLDGL
jgi:hypothetical protein